MGDRGKKDKDKSQKQKLKKQEQNAKKDLEKVSIAKQELKEPTR